MTAEELQAIIAYLKERICLGSGENKSPTAIEFHAPTEGEMVGAGLNAEGARQILRAPWWEEMIEDIVETPEMCDDEDPPERVLEYARDVVFEYVSKRFHPNT
jgi:hypothetical protein